MSHPKPNKLKSAGSTAAGTAAIMLILSGCESIPFLDGRGGAPAPAPVATTPAPAPSPAPKLPARKPGTINLVGNCDQREVDGFEESAQVVVENGVVRDLTWKMKIGRKGSCSFEGARFKQVRTKPSITLEAVDGSGCKLLMWSDPRRITLAHSNCAKYCKPTKVYDKAWPVMFDPNSGGCADNNKR
jgi:hypothetical protein